MELLTVSPPLITHKQVGKWKLNRGLERILEGPLGENVVLLGRTKLDGALWPSAQLTNTHRVYLLTSCRMERCMPFPIELEHKAYWALKQANFDPVITGDHRKVQLNELNELRDHAYENSLIYKAKTKRIHDSKIKNRVFNIGDRVLLFNSRYKRFSRGKLKSVGMALSPSTRVFPSGTVAFSSHGPNFKVNGHRVTHLIGGNVPQTWIARIVKTLSFVIHQEFHILSFIWESDILILAISFLFGILILA
ncbi:hypothetical protein Tco_1233653 [Tanacetum coccineum]